jgi:hypothetical protein
MVVLLGHNSVSVTAAPARPAQCGSIAPRCGHNSATTFSSRSMRELPPRLVRGKARPRPGAFSIFSSSFPLFLFFVFVFSSFFFFSIFSLPSFFRNPSATPPYS